jgi:predicted O-linked N-acetylglucosamine transferase (SPINDLY family)
MQAIACNLPVVTIEGSKMRGLLASAILNHIGLIDLVCRTNNSYVDLAVKLLKNREQLNAYRDKITQLKVTLFNDLEPIKALENFLIQQTRK